MKKLFLVLLLCSFWVSAEPININQADAEAISTALTGVGPKKAEAIVQYRKEHGDFKSLKDLEAVKGIGEKTAMANEKNILFGDGVPVPSDTKTEKTEKAGKAASAEKPDKGKSEVKPK
ncbi:MULTISPECIES: ComEA family DNA-binding protein [Methylomonas]|uniref:Competence protein ComEA n=1 Tax=Methylomonas koyamae TaxID=702114 RepID=A0A177NFG8_9GAMM|nr:helix-hairpin-helix domain-containing protein [Methylomonas koyamae]OAI16818.1 competence protein ComEA [Methylomonas koyamae]